MPRRFRPPQSIVEARRALRQQAWVTHITGTDLEAIPRYHFRAKTDKSSKRCERRAQL